MPARPDALTIFRASVPPAADTELRYAAIMPAGVWNIGFGLLAIFAATRGYTLMFTHSNIALYVIGGLLVAWGISQLVRSRRQ